MPSSPRSTGRWRRRKPSAPPSRPRSPSSRRPFRCCEERVEIRKTPVRQGAGLASSLYLTELQDLVGQRQDLLVQKSRLQRGRRGGRRADGDPRARPWPSIARGLFDELAKAEQKAAGLAQDVIKAEQRTSLQKLTAPVDGVVQQLAVHTDRRRGDARRRRCMVIVPADSHLEIEAMVSNRDIGFVEVGQEAEIKVDTFNFTRYGLLHGKVLTVSQDAIARDKPQDKVERQAARRGNEQQRAERPGAGLRRPRLARPHADAGRRQARQSLARHGRHRRDQDRLAHASSAICSRRSPATTTIACESDNGPGPRDGTRWLKIITQFQ